MSRQPVRHSNTIIFPASLDPRAVNVVKRLREAGYASYLVGGCVRDLLLGHIPKDFDVSTEARPRQLRRVFRNCRIIGRRFKLAHVHFGEKIIEVATFRRNPGDGEADLDGSETEAGSELDGTREAEPEGEAATLAADREDSSSNDPESLLITRDNVYGTAEEDTLRRDFTINALLYDVLTDEVIDYVGGFEDLQRRVLRTIGDADIRIAEDPVRMLRAIKFSSRLDLAFDPELDAAMRRSSALISASAPPRVLEEIFKLLTCGGAGRALRLLVEYGLLQQLVPEIAEECADGGARLEATGRALDLIDGARRRVSNAFLLAAMFHRTWERLVSVSDTTDPLSTARDLLSSAAQRMNIPRRDVSAASQLLLNQARLERGRRGRRFRMGEFLARQATRDAIELLHLRARDGSVDPDVHARWVQRLLEQLGSETAARPPEASASQEEQAAPERRRRRRGGRRAGRRRGGQANSRQDDGFVEQDAPDDAVDPTTDAADPAGTSRAAQLPPREPFPEMAQPGPTEPARPAPGRSLKRRLRSLLARVLPLGDADAPDAPDQGQDPGRREAAGTEPRPRVETLQADASEPAGAGPDGLDSHSPPPTHERAAPRATGEAAEPGGRRRRSRRRRRRGGERPSPGTPGNARTEQPAEARPEATPGSAPEAGADGAAAATRTADGGPARRKRTRGGRHRRRGAGGRDERRGEGGEKQPTSARPAQNEKPAPRRKRSDREALSTHRKDAPEDLGPAQRHPEDVEDIFDW